MSSAVCEGPYLRIKKIRGQTSYIFCRKKSVKKAVRRNRLKRIVRHLIQQAPAQHAVNIAICGDPMASDGLVLRQEWFRFLSMNLKKVVGEKGFNSPHNVV